MRKWIAKPSCFVVHPVAARVLDKAQFFDNRTTSKKVESFEHEVFQFVPFPIEVCCTLPSRLSCRKRQHSTWRESIALLCSDAKPKIDLLYTASNMGKTPGARRKLHRFNSSPQLIKTGGQAEYTQLIKSKQALEILANEALRLNHLSWPTNKVAIQHRGSINILTALKC